MFFFFIKETNHEKIYYNQNKEKLKEHAWSHYYSENGKLKTKQKRKKEQHEINKQRHQEQFQNMEVFWKKNRQKDNKYEIKICLKNISKN